MPLNESSSDAAARPLAGCHAFVTGASRGIGAAIASELASLGANVSISGRDEAALAEQETAISATAGVNAASHIMDVTEPTQISQVLENSAADFGSIDILVNNAGAATSAPFAKVGLKAWNDLLEINLTGPFLCTQAVLPAMIENGFGRIINVASTASLKGYGYVAPYCASKHGLLGLTRALAVEFAKSSVTFNAVCPGFTETDIAARTIDTMVEKTGRSAEEAYAELAKFNPQGRLVAPAEVAQAVGWLALPASSSFNGQAIAVDGGEVM